MKILDLNRFISNDKIDFNLIETELLSPFSASMRSTMQEFKWHQEGNVLVHTKMVLEELVGLEEYKLLNEQEKLLVFLGAVFHDIGKTITTKIVDDEIVSPNHGLKGEMLFREYFWKEFGFAGDYDKMQVREAVCMLIRYHSVPIHEYNNLEYKVIKTSSYANLAKLFNIKLLSILAKADVLGRIGSNKDIHLLLIDEFISQAKVLDCYDKPFVFTDNYSRYKYLSLGCNWPYQKLYDDTWGEVIMLCGLPGTGKDTYIRKYFSSYNVISLDEIREKYNLFSKDDQGKVYNIAKDIAKDYLRNKIPFV